MTRAFASCSLLMLFAGGPAQPVAAQAATDDLAFLLGTWSAREHGLATTVRFERMPSGIGIRERRWLDEHGRLCCEAIWTRREPDGRWLRTAFSPFAGRETATVVPLDGGVGLGMLSGQAATEVRELIVPGRAAESFARLRLPESVAVDLAPGLAERLPPDVERVEHRRVASGAATAAGDRIAFISKRTGDWEIHTMNPDGSDVRNVSQREGMDHRPRWLAGGERLAWSSAYGVADDEPWRRWESSPDGDGAVVAELPDGLAVPAAGAFPEVRCDGRCFAFAERIDDDWQLFVASVDGRTRLPLAHADGRDGRPRWSPDGRHVLFESDRDGNPELYAVAVDADGRGGQPRRLTETLGLERYAAWSPDGTRIAFASDRADGKTLELYVMLADGGDVRRLTDNDAEDGEPSWSPDGTRIVFRSNASGNPEICVVEVATGIVTNLSNDPAYDGEPSWSPAHRAR